MRSPGRRGRALRPVQRALGLPEIDQDGATERQGLGVVGVDGELALDALQAAAGGGLRRLVAAERAVALRGEAEGAEVVRLQFRCALEQDGGAGMIAARALAAAGEEVGFERVGRQGHGAIQFGLGFGSAAGGEQREALGGMGVGEVGLQLERQRTLGENGLERGRGVAHAQR